MTNLLNDLVLWLHQNAVVILDDYHLITTEAIQAMLQFLLDHVSAHMHQVIVSTKSCARARCWSASCCLSKRPILQIINVP
jgi:ATP/maltotriose-dependent transcriptional regulator MalT